jgi:hypothetical protein
MKVKMSGVRVESIQVVVVDTGNTKEKYEATITHDGKIRFVGKHSIGIVTNPNTGEGYLSQTGNTNYDLRHNAEPMDFGNEFMAALKAAAKPSENALKKLLGA